MEIFIPDSENSDVHSKDDNVLLYNNLPQIFFVPIVFLVFAFLLLLCNY